MLQAEPTNSALLYLRGRIEHDRAAATLYFRQSVSTDSGNPYPYFAMGYDQLSAGDWPQARSLLSRSVALRPSDRGFDAYLTTARLASGEAAQIEQESRLISLDQAVPVHDVDVDTLWERAWALMDLRGDKEVEPLLRQILSLRPMHTSANFHLGRLLLEKGLSEGQGGGGRDLSASGMRPVARVPSPRRTDGSSS